MSINGRNIRPLIYTMRMALYLHSFTRQELVKATGYSESSIYQHIRHLVACGFIAETGAVPHDDGRYSQACFTVCDVNLEPAIPRSGGDLDAF